MEFMKRARIRVCVIDNEDSFTYNLVQLLEAQNASVMIVSGKYTDTNLKGMPDKIIFSPGPGKPQDFPLMEKILITCIPTHDILGICLGHQAIAQHFGLKLERKLEVAHGIQEKIEISPKLNPKSILFGISEPIEVGLYHSWYVDRKMSNNILEISCQTGSGMIMGLIHPTRKIEGLQFHPESFLTPLGHTMISRWLSE